LSGLISPLLLRLKLLTLPSGVSLTLNSWRWSADSTSHDGLTLLTTCSGVGSILPRLLSNW